jgi:hypothetical protein
LVPINNLDFSPLFRELHNKIILHKDILTKNLDIAERNKIRTIYKEITIDTTLSINLAIPASFYGGLDQMPHFSPLASYFSNTEKAETTFINE